MESMTRRRGEGGLFSRSSVAASASAWVSASISATQSHLPPPLAFVARVGVPRGLSRLLHDVDGTRWNVGNLGVHEMKLVGTTLYVADGSGEFTAVDLDDCNDDDSQPPGTVAPRLSNL